MKRYISPVIAIHSLSMQQTLLTLSTQVEGTVHDAPKWDESLTDDEAGVKANNYSVWDDDWSE